MRSIDELSAAAAELKQRLINYAVDLDEASYDYSDFDLAEARDQLSYFEEILPEAEAFLASATGIREECESAIAAIESAQETADAVAADADDWVSNIRRAIGELRNVIAAAPSQFARIRLLRVG